MRYPSTVKTGDSIRADDHNGVIAWLKRAIRISPTNGIGAAWTDDGLSIWLANRSKEWMLPGRILAKTGGDPDFATNIRYTAGALGRYARSGNTYTGLVIADAYPRAGRPVKGADASLTKIRPANVGGMCWIVLDREPDNEGGFNDAGSIVLFEGGEWGETLYIEPCPNQ